MLDSLKPKRWHQDLLAVFLYSLSFVILTFPLIKYFSVGIAGFYTSDSPLYFWNVWELGQKISGGDWSFYTRDIFFPLGGSLAMHTNTLVQAAVTLLINVVFRNLTLSYNLVYLGSAVLGAYCAYLFFRLTLKDFWPAFLAGQFFGFQHLWAVYSLFGTQNLLSFWYLPATLAAYEMYQHFPKKRFLVLSGIFLGLAWWNEFLVFAFCGMALLLYAILRGVSLRQDWKQWVKINSVLALSWLVVSLPKFVLLFLDRKNLANLAVPSVSDVDFYHADIINLFRPSQFHLWWGSLSGLYRNVDLTAGNAFVGFTFILVVLLCIKFCRKQSFSKENKMWLAVYGLCAFFFLMLSWGPYLHIFGFNTHLPLPYLLFGKISNQFYNFRMAARWLFVFIFFLAGIFGILLKNIFVALSKKSLVSILAIIIYGGLVIDSLFIPKNILFTDAQKISPIFTEIKNSPPGTVVELPLSISSGYFAFVESARVSMSHQTIHNHSILGGHLSRLPFSTRDFYAQEPVVKYFLNFSKTLPDKDDLDKNKIIHFFDFYQAKYFVFDKQLSNPNAPESQRLFGYLTQDLGLVRYYEDSQVIGFKIK